MNNEDGIASTCWALVGGIPREIECDPCRPTAHECYDDEGGAWDAALHAAERRAELGNIALARGGSMDDAMAECVEIALVLAGLLAYRERRAREAARV